MRFLRGRPKLDDCIDTSTRDGRAMNARCVINKQTSRCGRRVASRRIGHRESRNVKGERERGREGEEENGFVPEPLEEDE